MNRFEAYLKFSELNINYLINLNIKTRSSFKQFLQIVFKIVSSENFLHRTKPMSILLEKVNNFMLKFKMLD